MTRVIIAEKPNMASDIANAIGGAKRTATHFVCGTGDVVTWCKGHLMEQAPPESYDERAKAWGLDYLPVIPDRWRKYVVADEKRQYEAIRGLIKSADVVIHAGDADREGNLIVDEVLESLECRKPVKRLWLLGLDDSSIKKALANMKPNEEYSGYTAAAEGRGRADWMIGMNFTRGFTLGWQSRNNTGTLHVGRVQTPTLWMVVMRDREIENFKPVDYYVPRFKFQHANGTFVVTWAPRAGTEGIDESSRVVDRRVADDLIRRVGGTDGRVANIKTERKNSQPPLPFNLAAITKEAYRAFGYSPDQVLEICQALYDRHHMTTYPRTNCGFLPESQHHEAKNVVAAVKASMGGAFNFNADVDLSRKSAAWNDAQAKAHHGIIPTATVGSFASLDEEEKNLYRMIVRNYLAQFCPDHVYDSTSVVVEAGPERDAFTAHGKVDVQLGWRTLFGGPESKEEKDDNQKLPDMAQGDPGAMLDGKIDAMKTKPPAPYNGASLIDDMENAHRFIQDAEVRKRLNVAEEDLVRHDDLDSEFEVAGLDLKKAMRKGVGIGTDATRADTVDNLIARGYIEQVGRKGEVLPYVKKIDRKKKKGKTEKGVFYRSTAKGRALIDSLPDVIRRPDLTAYFEDMMGKLEAGVITLEAFTERQAKFVTRIIGEIKSGEALLNMPTGMVTDGKGKSGGGQPSGPVATHACIEPGCTSTMKRRLNSKTKRYFWVCDNEHFADDKDGEPVKRTGPEKLDKPCPACGGDLLIRNSKRGKFVSCGNYPKCTYTEDLPATAG